MTDKTPIIVTIDAVKLMDKTISRIAEREDFCYPEGKLKAINSEMVLLSIGQISKSLTQSVELFKEQLLGMDTSDIPDDAQYPVFLDYMSKMADKILKQKEFCYVDKQFIEGRVHTALQVIGGIHNSHAIFKTTIMKDMTENLEINLERMLTTIMSRNILTCYNYAYPDDRLSHERSHNALGAIQSNLKFGFDFIGYIDLENLPEELKKSIDHIQSGISQLYNIIYEAYPDNQFSKEMVHPTFNKFLERYKSFQQSYLREFAIISSIKKDLVKNDDLFNPAISDSTLKVRNFL